MRNRIDNFRYAFLVSRIRYSTIIHFRLPESYDEYRTSTRLSVPFILYLVRFCSSKSCKKYPRDCDDDAKMARRNHDAAVAEVSAFTGCDSWWQHILCTMSSLCRGCAHCADEGVLPGGVWMSLTRLQASSGRLCAFRAHPRQWGPTALALSSGGFCCFIREEIMIYPVED